MAETVSAHAGFSNGGFKVALRSEHLAWDEKLDNRAGLLVKKLLS